MVRIRHNLQKEMRRFDWYSDKKITEGSRRQLQQPDLPKSSE